MKFYVVGTFTKRYHPFKRVVELAKEIWQKQGILKVSQKDYRTFIFKFDSLEHKSEVLAKGTWFFAQSPLVISDWGTSISDPVKCLPLWFKLSQVPACYWTEEGLSSLASVIGTPICSDDLTAQLDILPFAKMCTIGDPLLDKISAMALDARGVKTQLEVLVSYFSKPLVCPGCKNLGHLISSCPSTQRIWVQKIKPATCEKSEEINIPSDGNLDDPGVSSRVLDEVKVQAELESLPVSAGSPKNIPSDPTVEDGAPSNSFKNLKRIDEIDLVEKNDGKRSNSKNKKHKNVGSLIILIIREVGFGLDGIDSFGDLMFYLLLLNICPDLRGIGSYFTWRDKSPNTLKFRKIDRVLVNAKWLSDFPLSYANFLPRGVSDHCPAAHPQFIPIVSEAWNCSIEGDPWWVLTNKLKRVEFALIRLNKDMGNVCTASRPAHNALLDFQNSLPQHPSLSQIENEALLISKYNEANCLEEELLRQKSRVKWLEKAISEVAVNFFKDTIGSAGSVVDFPEVLELRHLHPNQAEYLIAPISD
ncbi:hypothetical protein AgCh_005202 [Apium graveolens]